MFTQFARNKGTHMTLANVSTTNTSLVNANSLTKLTRKFAAHTIISVAMLTSLSGCSSFSASTHPVSVEIMTDMVLVEGGTFIMGSDLDSSKKSEKPAHEVSVNSFYISKYEVTQALFESVMGGSNSFFVDPNTPVNNLSWQQAVYFIERLNKLTGDNFRLPTEAEWEFAAIGGNHSKGFIYSGSNNIDDVAWYAANSKNSAQPVGLKMPNELGLYDMTGNVGEFVIDQFDERFYLISPKNNPNNAQHSDVNLTHKSTRGGSFAYDADESENFRRDFASQSILMSDLGLRLAKDAK